MEMDTDNADFELVSESDSRCGLVPPGAKKKGKSETMLSKKRAAKSYRNGEAKGKSLAENKTMAKLNRKSFGSNKTFPFRCSGIMCK